MKMIDLLVKKANKERIPQKIKFMERIWEKRDHINNYYCEHLDSFLSEYIDFTNLNNEIKIIEDKPEKIDQLSISKKIKQNYGKDYSLTHQEFFIQDKLNEVIDKLNYLLEKSDKE